MSRASFWLDFLVCVLSTMALYAVAGGVSWVNFFVIATSLVAVRCSAIFDEYCKRKDSE